MSLSKSKCWYSSNCLHFIKVHCFIVNLGKFGNFFFMRLAAFGVGGPPVARGVLDPSCVNNWRHNIVVNDSEKNDTSRSIYVLPSVSVFLPLS